MSGSQNAFCIGAAPPDPDDEGHPPGIALAGRLVDVMRASGLAFFSPENWRDVGWSSFWETEEITLEMCLWRPDESKWSLQFRGHAGSSSPKGGQTRNDWSRS